MPTPLEAALGGIQALHASIRLGQKWLKVTKTPTYYIVAVLVSSLTFVSKVSFYGYTPDLASKCLTRMKVADSEKHTSLLHHGIIFY